MDNLKLHTPDFIEANIAKLAELFPNCVTESLDENGELKKAIDFDLLKQELSTSVVEGPQERYQLSWPGKREALLTANAPIAKTLRPCREESVDFDNTKNLYIEGDNLDALKLLQETYLGKVKLIYIDPPYNTGNDFIYEDDFAEDAESYFQRSNQKDEVGNRLVSNNESNGRFHSDWLSMIYPRIKLARNLLKDDGVLFVSIDDNEVANLKDICGEIFGRNNFLGQICVVSNLKGRSDDKYFASAHNYLLAYSKGSFNSYGIPLPADYLDEYSLTDDEGRKYRVQGLRKRGSSAKREDRPKMFYSFFIDPGNGTIALSSTNRHTVEVIPKLSDGSDGRWRWGKETAQERLKELVAQSVGPEKRWDIFQIDYADSDGDVKRIKPKSVWMGSEFSNESGTLEVKELLGKGIFDTPKPLGLIKYLLEQTVDDDSVVVDFFAGSASTAHAVFEFNFLRQKSIKFICIQLAEDTDNKSEAYKNGYKTISDISKERIRRAGQKIKQDNVDKDGIENLDIGFRVLKIDSSNMKDVYYTPDQLNQAHLDQFTDNIKDDRTAEDLLFQVLLDWGVDLTLPITQETIAGKTVLFVDGNALAACFDADINESFVKELATRHPLRVVFRDAGFVGDSVKINVEQVFKLISPTTEIKVI